MPRYGRTTAATLPLVDNGKVEGKNSKKFEDKESQAMIDKIRKEHSTEYAKNRSKEYNPNVDQQRVWSERSPQAYDIPYQSLGRSSHLNHPQLKEESKQLPKETKKKKQ